MLTKAHQEASLCDEVQDFLSGHGIKWTLIVELAPWMGGFYERLVGITKRVLRKTLGTDSLTLIQLYIVLTEAEAVVNSRPLVYVSDDDSGHVIVPNDFLSMNTNNMVCEEYREGRDSDYQPTCSHYIQCRQSTRCLETWTTEDETNLAIMEITY